MFSTYLVGCSVSQFLARMWVLWFAISKAMLANPLPFSSFFEVMAVQIGAKNMHSGARKKMRNGQLWVPKKAMQK